MRYFFGVDLGKREDYSALAMIEYDHGLYHLRWLWRWPTGTEYRVVAAHTAEWVAKLPWGQRALVVDGTGVGDAVVELFKSVRLDPIEVVLTGGKNTTRTGRRWHTPRESLFSVLLVALEQRTLRVTGKLDLVQTFLAEMDAMPSRPAPDPSHDTEAYRAGRQQPHDDLVFAVALACWWASLWAKALPPLDLPGALGGLRKSRTWPTSPTDDKRVRLPQRLFAEDVQGLGAASQLAAMEQSWERQKQETYDQQRSAYEQQRRERWKARHQDEGSQGAV
jgi:hypothetical protein